MPAALKHQLPFIARITAVLFITFTAWFALVLFREYLLPALANLIFSVALVIYLLRKQKPALYLLLLLNPYFFLTGLSFSQGLLTVMAGEPQLVFVCYSTNDYPYCVRDTKIKNRWSVDPELGILDYMGSIPNNIAVRTCMSFAGKVDRPFLLIYKDELPDDRWLPDF